MTPMVKVPPAAPEASPLALPAVSPLVLAPPASLPEVPALLLPPQATRARAMGQRQKRRKKLLHN